PFTRRAGGLHSALQVEVQPRSGFLGTAKQSNEKLPPLAGKLCQDVRRWLQWTKLVAGIERCPFFQIAVQFQVGKQRTDNKLTDIVSGGQVIQADIKVFSKDTTPTEKRLHGRQ